MGLTQDSYGVFKDWDDKTVDFVRWARARSSLLVVCNFSMRFHCKIKHILK